MHRLTREGNQKTFPAGAAEVPNYMKKERRNIFNATVTPLASIFGSGFLVIVPILAGAVGKYSVFAMLGVCLVAISITKSTLLRLSFGVVALVLALITLFAVPAS